MDSKRKGVGVGCAKWKWKKEEEVAGAGARENREREGYGRREKKGREAGSLRWAGSRIEIQKGKLSLFVTAVSSSQWKEPNNNRRSPRPPPPPQINQDSARIANFIFISFFRSFAVSVFFVVLFFFHLPLPFLSTNCISF